MTEIFRCYYCPSFITYVLGLNDHKLHAIDGKSSINSRWKVNKYCICIKTYLLHNLWIAHVVHAFLTLKPQAYYLAYHTMYTLFFFLIFVHRGVYFIATNSHHQGFQ